MASILDRIVRVVLPAIAVLGVACMAWIGRELLKRCATRIAERLELTLSRRVTRYRKRYRRRFTRYHKRYQRRVLSELRFIDHKGLATVGFFTPELDDIFVDVGLAYRAPHKVPDSVLADVPAEVTDRHSIIDFLDRDQPVILAVIGAPGSGKTTLLRHTARQACLQSCRRRRTIPILLYLRDHVPAIVSNPRVGIATLLRATSDEDSSQREPAGWFEDRLRNGDCVVLLDGLDEVAKPNDRRTVADWVQRQAAQYPKNDYVVTSRPQGYRVAHINGAVVLQVRGFTDTQVVRFVQGWYLAVKKRSTGTSDDDVRRLAESAADDLLTRLRNAPALYDLTVNPLLLTMIANVHQFRGALPGSRVDLYGEICQGMLWRRGEAKLLQSDLSGDRKEMLLRRLAFTMMERQLRDIGQEDLLAEVQPSLRRISTSMTEMDFVADVIGNGLLVEREAGIYSFAHLTFQEYLAAMCIRDEGPVDILAKSVDDVWWRETTLLYAARSNADAIVKSCLESGEVTALALAFDIAPGGDVDPDLRNRLDDLLGLLGSGSVDPARQRLLAGVLATRYLSQDLIRTGTASRVCGRPINVETYEMFITAAEHPRPDGVQPAGDLPVVGVRASDAAAFVRWVNAVTGGVPGYRLPTHAEFNDPAVHRALSRVPTLRFWLDPGGDSGLPRLSTSVNPGQPNRIESETLAHHFSSDFERSTHTIARLVLLQALAFARALGNALARARSRELDSELVRARGFARNLVTALDQAVDLVPAIGRARELSRVRADSISIAGHLHHARGSDLDRVHEISRDLSRYLGKTVEGALDITLALDYTLTGDDEPFPDYPLCNVVGKALDTALSAALKREGKARSWRVEFEHVFVRSTRVTDIDIVVVLDEFDEIVSTARQRLCDILGSNISAWTNEVAKRLEEIALPMFARQRQITAKKASAIRIASLCLAAEADDKDGTSVVGDIYRQIAAGITLLERRTTGESHATEAIILATA